jgi:hypothetical protein
MADHSNSSIVADSSPNKMGVFGGGGGDDHGELIDVDIKK